jgi:hypothetical protein
MGTLPDQGTLRLTLLNVEGLPAADPDTSVSIIKATTNEQIAHINHLVFPTSVNINLPSFPLAQGLMCWINPKRFRTCHSNIFTLTDGQTLAQSPTVFRTPGEWSSRFTHWADLAAPFGALQKVLTASANVVVKESNQPLGNFAGAIYDDVDETPAILAKTALLNLYFKMHKVPVATGGAADWFAFVQSILIIGQERFIGIVTPPLWDAVNKIFNSIGDFPGFVQADTALHTGNIPSPYAANVTEMVSIKSNDAHGNLQLTMARAADPATGDVTFLLDADIDEDLNFFLHARDLFVHIFSGGTHPVDVHEILTSAYGPLNQADLGYQLV